MSAIPDLPSRRHVLGAGALGITTLALPAAAAAATGGSPEALVLTAPTEVTAVPSGYVSAGTTGAITVAWAEVAGASSYEVRWSTAGVSGPFDAGPITTTGTSVTIADLDGADASHHVVVVARSGAVTSPASTAVAATPVIAVGGTGTMTTYVGDGTNGTSGATYVVHTFLHDGSGDEQTSHTLVLNAAIALDRLIVGGGGGGGGATGRGFACGGGGGGEVVTGTRAAAATPGESLAILVGRGGSGGPNTANSVYAGGGAGSSLDGVTARGGGAGGSAPTLVDQTAATDAAALPTGSPRFTGGGGVAQVSAQTGAIGAGFDGASGIGSNTVAIQFAGGGAGAGGDGLQGSGTRSGDGGQGIVSTITGAAVEYGSGGGGGKRNSGSGGAGGRRAETPEGGSAGGAGGMNDAGSSAPAGRGGGGGGGGREGAEGEAPAAGTGGAGGSGVVIVRYEVPAPVLPQPA